MRLSCLWDATRCSSLAVVLCRSVSIQTALARCSSVLAGGRERRWTACNDSSVVPLRMINWTTAPGQVSNGACIVSRTDIHTWIAVNTRLCVTCLLLLCCSSTSLPTAISVSLDTEQCTASTHQVQPRACPARCSLIKDQGLTNTCVQCQPYSLPIINEYPHVPCMSGRTTFPSTAFLCTYSV